MKGAFAVQVLAVLVVADLRTRRQGTTNGGVRITGMVRDVRDAMGGKNTWAARASMQINSTPCSDTHRLI